MNAPTRLPDDHVSENTARLAAYIAATLDRDLPEDVAEKARHHITDTVAAMVSGSQLKAGELAIAYVRAMAGAPFSSVVGAGFLTSPADAALANGMMGHADETDDSHLVGRFHPGCAIVPAALAIAEYAGASGRDLLRAVALGYDVGVRFNLSMGPRKLYAGGHSTHSVGTLFGAAAAAAALLRLDERQVRYCLSYAAQQASGIQCWSRDHAHVEKAFDFGGMAARNGVSAALMVAHGFSAVPDSFSGDNDFFSAFSQDPRPDELSAELGQRYELRRATIKKWCVGSPVQGAIDAVTTLMERDGLRAEDVEAIRIELPDDRCRLVDNRGMPNINVQHLVGLTLVDSGLTFANSHDPGRMTDERILRLRACTTLVPNPELTTAVPARQVILAVRTKDGRELFHRTRAVRGTPDDPMTRAEVLAKATDLVVPVLGADRGARLVETLIAIDDVTGLAARLRPLLKADTAQ
jgi:2-methylcitrate dehydratase PrpD